MAAAGSSADVSAAVAVVRANLSHVSVPGPHDKVYRECPYSFDTPESDEGIFTSLANHQAFGKAFLAQDRKKNAGRANLYLQQKWRRVAKPVVEGAAPSPLTATGPLKVGAEDQPWEWAKEAFLVVFTNAADPNDLTHVTLSHPAQTSECPALVLSAIEAILGAVAAEAQAAPSGVWEDVREVSRFALELVQLPLPEGVTISAHPQDWKCGECDKRDNLWLNLSDGFIGCGRRQPDGSGGNGHALSHFQATGNAFPLCVKLGTITPAGADVYSYSPDEDDMVEDPLLAKHLAHFGINIMNLAKTEKTVAELTVELNANFEFGRISESGKKLISVTGPGFIGLENLGNTCYMNACMQVIATLPGARELYAQPAARVDGVYSTAPARAAAEDVITQTIKLFSFLATDAGARYALDARYLNRPSMEEKEKTAGVSMVVEASVDATATATALAATGDMSAGASSLTTTTAVPAGAQAAHAASAATHTAAAGGAGADADDLPPEPGAGGKCGFVNPRMFKSLIGKGHAEFATNKQQDAAQFLEWLFGQLEKAHMPAAARQRLPPLADGTLTLADLFTYTAENRLQDNSSGGVRYRASKERFLRFNIPLEAATNKAEVDEAKKAIDAAAAAADAAEAAAAGNTSSAAGASGGAADAEPSAKRIRVEVTDTSGKTLQTLMLTEDEAKAAKAAVSGGGGAGKKVQTAGDKLRAERMKELPKLKVPFEALLAQYASPGSIEGWKSPVTGEITTATTNTRFATFPRVMAVVLNRYMLGRDWKPVKIDAEIPLPLEFDLGSPALGLKALGGLQAGELSLDQLTEAAGGNAGSGAASAPEPNAAVVEALMGMGFPEGACKRAALATGNSDSEAAMGWILSHMDDADFADPYVAPAPAPSPAAGGSASAGASAVDPAFVEMLTSMGFDEARAKYALKQTNNDAERAADWLFSHMDEPIPSESEQAAAAAGGGAAGGAGGGAAGWADADAAASGKYELVGFVSHMGNDTGSGHYVCHVRKDDATGSAPVPGKPSSWYIVNDTKVARSEDPPLDLGYIYFYRRVE